MATETKINPVFVAFMPPPFCWPVCFSPLIFFEKRFLLSNPLYPLLCLALLAYQLIVIFWRMIIKTVTESADVSYISIT
ncbi:hypothetical protein KSS82_09005 [Vibrio mimicus]|nr:hypothetical protein [Vibrio mimicus]QXC58207.1 hypothetical protein KSS82_09005 [Vibrio mimicus]